MRCIIAVLLAIVGNGCCVITPTMNAILNGNAKLEKSDKVECQKTEEITTAAEMSTEVPKLAEVTLWDVTSPESHIYSDECFTHDGKNIKVVQVVDESLKSNVGHCYVLCISGLPIYERLSIGVISRHSYVTGEMLRPGSYQYAGPHTYVTKAGDNKTIRLFYELPRETELTDEEKGIER